jgi:hypothetical protein
MSTTLFEAIHADPWAEQIVDLPSLNADVSTSIEEAIARQRHVARRQPKELRSSSLVVVGPPGAGKTHLFARLRQRLGPKAVFVHIRPLLNSEMTARFVLQEIAKQLSYATMGLRQTDALVGSLLAHLGGAPAQFPRAFLDDLAGLDGAERTRHLEDSLERVLATWQDVDESYLRRLMSVPFDPPATQRATMAWLSGRECDESQLQRVGARSSLHEEAVVPALRTLAAVASLGSPIVIVFDQLENLIDGQESRSRLLAYGNLAAELVDSARGVVLVHMAIDSEWHRAIEPALSGAQQSRIAMRTKALSLPTAHEREELLRLWTAREPNPKSPFPWPFGERRVARWCSAPGMTPRMLLVECRLARESGRSDDDAIMAGHEVVGDGFPVHPAGTEVLKDSLADEWAKQVESARRTLDELAEQAQCADPARLADGFMSAADFVSNLTLEVNLRAAAQLGWGTNAGKLRMALLHQNHPRSLGSTLAKLATLAEKEVVLALRERVHDLPPTWKDTLAKRAAFVAQGNAKWVLLEREDAARLLALASMLTAARSGDVTDALGRPVPLEGVRRWVADTLDVASWPVLTSLTSAPGELPDDPGDPRVGSSNPGIALGVLGRLRVASLDRLIREVARVDRSATRASTLLELERASDRVLWIGGTLICMKGEP